MRIYFLCSKSEYSTGHKTSVKTVANPSPNIMAYAMEFHISPPLIASGSNPMIVVTVVIKIGLNRDLEASIIPSITSRPPEICVSVSSIIKMALLTMIPIKAMIPSIVIKPKVEPVISKPAVTPIIIGGMVMGLLIHISRADMGKLRRNQKANQ